MPKTPINWRLWTKVAIALVLPNPTQPNQTAPPAPVRKNPRLTPRHSGLFFGVGGPLFTAWVSPSEEEIRAKYNPDLRRRSIEGKAAREQEFDEFVTKLKEYSKSDKPSIYPHSTYSGDRSY